MALTEYDVDRHHIGLQESGGETNYGFTVVGSFQKDLQRSAAGAQDFGGSTDLIGLAPSLSRVTQDDFTGGAYQYTAGKDDAMFASCSGFTSQQQSRGLVTAPPLYFKHAFDASDEDNAPTDPVTPHSFFMVAGSIYACFPHGILRYEIGTDTPTWAALYADEDTTLVAAEYDSNDQMIYTLWNTTVGDDRPFVARIKTDLTYPTHNPLWIGPVGSENYVARGMQIRDTGVVVALNNKLWVMDTPDDTTVDGDPVWTKIGRMPGRWRAAVPFAGLTYILCTDGAYKTSVVAFDGTSILPICTIPYAFEGKDIAEYAGRLYLGGVGTDLNGGEYYAELYELTGASVRLVRSFAPEVNRADGAWPHVIRSLAVHEGLLWFNHNGARLMSYDITSDGIFGSCEYQAGSTTFDVYASLAGRGRMWHWGHDTADVTKAGIYRVAQPADSVSAYTPEVVTSDFAFEVGLKKRFAELRIFTRYASATAQYSINGGSTWTTLTPSVQTGGANYLTTFSLSAVPASEFIRFRIKLPMSTNVTTFAELIAYTWTFALLDTGLRAWTFTIANVDEIEGRDGESITGDVSGVADQLWDWAIDKSPLTFTDTDGASAEVQIVGIREVQPIVGPNIGEEMRPESHFALSLLEIGN